MLSYFANITLGTDDLVAQLIRNVLAGDPVVSGLILPDRIEALMFVPLALDSIDVPRIQVAPSFGEEQLQVGSTEDITETTVRVLLPPDRSYFVVSGAAEEPVWGVTLPAVPGPASLVRAILRVLRNNERLPVKVEATNELVDIAKGMEITGSPFIPQFREDYSIRAYVVDLTVRHTVCVESDGTPRNVARSV